MKLKTFIFIGGIYLLVLLITAGCATTKNPVSEEDFFKVWSGTWVNTDIPGDTWVPQKLVTRPGGTFSFHVYVTDSIPFCLHTFVLIDQWTDGEDAIWFSAKTTCPVQGNIFYQYGKIHDSGNILEIIHHAADTPIKKWEPDSDYYNYGIYYRVPSGSGI
ncbi:MAG: hypothetical protein E4H36_08060 [Spirochaetales bacterium]|nr:MAG: hypothetical protein E4H36_08060 [Spirochaetales bacterium]